MSKCNFGLICNSINYAESENNECKKSYGGNKSGTCFIVKGAVAYRNHFFF